MTSAVCFGWLKSPTSTFLMQSVASWAVDLRSMKDGTRLVWQAGEPSPVQRVRKSAWQLAPVGSLLAALLQRGHPSELQERGASKQIVGRCFYVEMYRRRREGGKVNLV